MTMTTLATLGVIVGNRDFFPDALIAEARREFIELFNELSIQPVWLSPDETKQGAVEGWADAQKCGALFHKNADRLDGVLVCLPNFGDERSVADSLRLARVNVPVLVQACPDDLDHFDVERRRDSFCGKISVCNNLRQYGIPYSITRDHTVALTCPRFREDLLSFVSTCKVVRGLRGARIGAIGARPNAFNTTRFSEKLFESSGITINTIDMSEILGNAGRLVSNDPRVRERVEKIRAYADASGAPNEAIVKMAKLALVIDDWMQEQSITATAVQCWNSLQANYGINPCTVMSMMSQRMLPSACEVDVAGTVSMYALQLASGTPSALIDWNNNYGNDPDKCVLFHCGNWAKAFVPEPRIATAPILGTTLGEENTYGALEGRAAAGPLTFGRISTDDLSGRITAYVGEGEYVDDPLKTFGMRAVVKVPHLQDLLHVICQNGFEHHTAMSRSHVAAAVAEAFNRYFKWETYHHNRPAGLPPLARV
jgi:L-fucose isomerase-like protein